MESRTIIEISRMDSLALTAILDNWKEFEPKMVLWAYAELKRRNYSFPERLQERKSEFCAKFHKATIDLFLSDYVYESGYSTYEQYLNHEISRENRSLEKETFKIPGDVNNEGRRYPALRIISVIFKIFAWVVGIFTILLAILQIAALGEWGIILSFGSILGGTLITLLLMAISESLIVFVDIERNTRNKN